MLTNRYKLFFAIAISAVVCACTPDDDTFESEESSYTTVNETYKMVVMDWSATVDEVEHQMKSAQKIDSGEDNVLQYMLNGGQGISYLFSDDMLCASAVLLPSLNFGGEKLLKERGYKLLGYLDEDLVFANEQANTMATISSPCDADSTYSSLVFAPIDTDLFESLYPVQLESGIITMDLFNATSTGRIFGVENPVEVGFIYGADEYLSSGKEQVVSTNSKDEFTLTMSGLVDRQTYYFKPYANVEGICYYGETSSFTTDKLTYQLDGGREFEMVVVEGENMQSFSISQTEIPISSVLTINGKSVGSMDCNDDNNVTLYEVQKFFNNLKKETGLELRQPSLREWQYAAHGGKKSGGFKFSGSDNIDDVAWYSGNSEGSLHAPALKAPNELGLYDMSGNYGEVCLDDNKPEYDQCNTDGPICGGCWNDKASLCTIESTKESPVTGLIPGTSIREQHAFDGQYIAIRLAVTRP